jgi:hypothetical protein
MSLAWLIQCRMSQQRATAKTLPPHAAVNDQPEGRQRWLVACHLLPNTGELAWSTFQSKKSYWPDQAWTLLPHTSQLKVPECLSG